MNHSTSKRQAKALPQVESTMLVEGVTAKIIKCKARKAFTLGNASVRENETFFLVKSERRINRYYVVHFNESRGTYQCSCGANCSEHSHLREIRELVHRTIVKPANPEAPAMTTPATVKEIKDRKAKAVKVESATSEFDGSRKLTADEWKAIQKQDRARQKAWALEYRQAAEALRKETA